MADQISENVNPDDPAKTTVNETVENGSLENSQVVESGTQDSAETTTTVSSSFPKLSEQFTATNVSQEYEHVKPTPTDYTVNLDQEHVVLPSISAEETVLVANESRDISDLRTEKDNLFLSATSDSIGVFAKLDQYQETITRINSSYKQYLQTEKGKIGFSVPKFADKDTPTVSGTRALLRIRAVIGQGSLITIPLYHSGFHITIQAPKDSALLELRRRLMEDKIKLGRETGGIVFSNTQAYTSGWLLDMISELYYDCTLKNAGDWRKRVKIPDLPILIWGLACSIWPNGFQYSRPVLTEQGVKEKQIITGKIDVSKLMWVDNNAFSDKQKGHMTNRLGSTMSDEAVESYIGDFHLYSGRQIEINENLKINLKVPNIDEFVESGHRWVSETTAIVERTLSGDNVDPAFRRLAISNQAKASSIRMYSHWVESLVVDDSVQTDLDTILEALEIFSSDKEITKKIYDGISKYIDDVTYAVIAIPETSGKETGLPRFPRLIPIDVMGVFFTLLIQRIDLLLNR